MCNIIISCCHILKFNTYIYVCRLFVDQSVIKLLPDVSHSDFVWRIKCVSEPTFQVTLDFSNSRILLKSKVQTFLLL